MLGNDERQFGVQSISFERAGLRISVAGTAPRSVLLDATQSVHVATGAELGQVARRRAAAGRCRRPAPAAAAIQVAGDHLSSGEPYSVAVDPVIDAQGTVLVRLQSGGVAGITSVTPHDSYIATVATPTMTALVAFVDPAIADARLVVAIGDPAAPTMLSAIPVELPGGLHVAALAFDQMQPYDASIHTHRRRARCPSPPADRRQARRRGGVRRRRGGRRGRRPGGPPRAAAARSRC